MKKASLLIVILLVTLCSCSKKKDAGAGDNTLKYTATLPSDIHIWQYKDTTIAVPISPRYTSGVSEPVTITFGDHPAWALFTATATTTVVPDSIAIFPIRFHPYQAGTYSFVFSSKSLSSDMQSYSINIIVDPLPDCSAYLAGNYTKIAIQDPHGVGFPFTAITNSSTGFIRIGPIYAYVNCKQKSIDIPSQAAGSNISYSGSGTFKNDTVSLQIIRNTFSCSEMDEYIDTGKILLIRK